LTTKNELIVVERQLDVGYKTLNFIMGVDIGQELGLTSSLTNILEAPEFTNIAISQFVLDSHIDYKMASNNLDRKNVNHKYQRSFYYPRLNGYLSHSQTAQRNEFNIFESGQPWYPTTVWGLKLNVPIWSSGQRHFSTQRAKIASEQAEIELKETSQDLLLGLDKQRQNFIAAESKFENETKNLDLAKRIFDTSTAKYSEGLSSSLELTQKQSQYLLTQRVYIQGLVDLLVARTELQKALNLY
jgi:outer membrane protein